MKTASLSNLDSGVIIAVLVILTAWGSALAMLAVSVLGIAIGLLLFGRDFARRGAVVAVLVCVIAFFVGFLLQRS